jgi:crotonobetainyl-CoA:carnitine CoA-transferase CaiB-like acyl-CoA transferase
MERTGKSGPLSGLKILDFSSLLPGPFATLYLADLGATVLRIGSGSRPDPLEARQPIVPETGISVFSTYLGRGKLALNLNLKNPRAREIIYRLIRAYDILMEQFRPGVMAKLGLDYESLKKINPALIYCSLTGYGQTGPLTRRAGHDINYLALSGLMAYSGRRENGPSLTGMQIADLAAGSLNAVIGILAAVIHRKETGEGQQVDISMTDGATAFNVVQGTSLLFGQPEPVREGERLNGGSLYDFYETRDGHYMSVGSLEPQFFQAFCEAVQRPDLVSGGIAPKEIEKVKEEIQHLFRSKTRAEWEEIFRQVDACVEPVLSLSEALNSELARSRGMVVDLNLPQGGAIRQLGNPIRFSGPRQEYVRPGVPAGTHTKEIVLGLGYSEEEYLALEREGIFS